MNKSVIIGIIVGIVIIGIGITISLSSTNNNGQISEIEIEPIEVPQTGKNITIELSESIGLKTP
ncbi:hypothetical protein [Nitrosarchaeum koreense]|uniref:Uncharacterized protein n=1 Tax=Nitrosarchaeum koreense MY1 TaxID=1001994 RepID=F9CV09_9ARCH|nr:hypothetical protein [Nitrosarchaeum koreense]EGP94713.1 hypothetical protein MY1_1969 [Nitrosarchaeum koreense MY1]